MQNLILPAPLSDAELVDVFYEAALIISKGRTAYSCNAVSLAADSLYNERLFAAAHAHQVYSFFTPLYQETDMAPIILPYAQLLKVPAGLSWWDTEERGKQNFDAGYSSSLADWIGLARAQANEERQLILLFVSCFLETDGSACTLSSENHSASQQ